MTKIKICGLSREEDIQFINEAKPDYCGFIINFAVSRRNISPERLRELKRHLVPGIQAVGVFVNEDPKLIAELLNEGTLDLAQLHGDESEEYIKDIKKLTDKPIIKAFRVKEAEDVRKAFESSADRILLDSGKGSGKTFDWSVLEHLPDTADEKRNTWFLAGGLDAENIPEAIARFHPGVIDLSSAVEKDGVKDREKILEAVAVVRNCQKAEI